MQSEAEDRVEVLETAAVEGVEGAPAVGGPAPGALPAVAVLQPEVVGGSGGAVDVDGGRQRADVGQQLVAADAAQTAAARRQRAEQQPRHGTDLDFT